jgi:Protein of unknown function (DUF4056)
LQGSGGSPTVVPVGVGGTEGEATIIKPVPRDLWLTVAQAIAYDNGLGHEIASYDWPVSGGHNSSFSPEDLCSNFVGTVVARLAIGEGGAFPRKVDVNLTKLLRALRAQSPDETQKAFDKIKKRWVNFDNTLSCAKNDYLRRRNFTRQPWKVGHFSDAKTPAWVLTGFGCAEPYYTYTYKASTPLIPKSDFTAKILQIRSDAKARYGNDYDKP